MSYYLSYISVTVGEGLHLFGWSEGTLPAVVGLWFCRDGTEGAPKEEGRVLGGVEEPRTRTDSTRAGRG